MASGPSKPKDSAEKAYATAVAKAGPAKAAAPAKPAPAKKPVAVKKAPKPVAKPSPEVAAPVVPVAEAPEPVVPAVEVPELPVTAVADVQVPVVEAVEPAAPVEVLPPQPTITELKEKIMATAKTPDFTKPVSEAIGEFQSRATAAYEKSTEALTEATEFAKGNVEAIVESGKILAAGAQDLGKGYVEEAKSAYETLTADLKEFAGVKSPTELFQLQGKIARRNFDALVAASSKNTEAVLKLANDTFAPLSGRVNLAAEKISKAA
ncbi:MAG TPA: phasin family protein [Croceibacterium sp.]